MGTYDQNYQTGFGNYLSSEAIPGSLPLGQNSPQHPPLGLYPEQISGTAFTAPPGQNQRTWVYRVLPSVVQHGFRPWTGKTQLAHAPFHPEPAIPEPLRWDPPQMEPKKDFFESLITVCGSGSHESRVGSAVHLYAFGMSRQNRYLCFADGELLLVPQLGALQVYTELGLIELEPGEIAVIPRGLKFKVIGRGDESRGYLLENYGEPLRLPWRGPIGANGLAHERDFLVPRARFEEQAGSCELIFKFDGGVYGATLEDSPLNVVAWHGNYVPYKYDLRKFNTINTVSFDHPDPSIFTVLTSPTTLPGTANLDFVIFPPRWMVAEKTFRPPYFHRNVMSEYMGLIYGTYDAKPSGGFIPGGGSLHNMMTSHGPEWAAFQDSTEEVLKPNYLADTLAFMFESSLLYRPTPYAMKTPGLQKNYQDCWKGFKPASLPRL